MSTEVRAIVVFERTASQSFEGQVTRASLDIIAVLLSSTINLDSASQATSTSRMPRVLVIGGGGIGIIAALNLYLGAACHVTMVLRSSHDKIIQEGFVINSIDHGKIASWKPHASNYTPLLSAIVGELYVVEILTQAVSLTCSTFAACGRLDSTIRFCSLQHHNLPDISPTTLEIVQTSITPAKMTVILLQNGLIIEKPFLAHFPQNVVLSGISYTSSHETSHGVIKQTHPDNPIIGVFPNSNISESLQHDKAQEFVTLYNKGNNTNCRLTKQTGVARSEKLIYNASFNPVCANLNTDTGALRRWQMVQGVVRPAMHEIIAVAKAKGIVLGENIVDDTLRMDEECGSSRPSMSVDVAKVRQLLQLHFLGHNG